MLISTKKRCKFNNNKTKKYSIHQKQIHLKPQIMSYNKKQSYLKDILKEKANEYDDLMLIFTLRRNKLVTEIRECVKHYKILQNGKSFVGLQNYSFLEDSQLVLKTFKNYENIMKYFQISNPKLTNLNNVLLKEWAYVHAFSQVFYRKKYNLLYTIPKKKIQFIQRYFPNIRKNISESYFNDKKYNLDRNWYPGIDITKKRSFRFKKVRFIQL